MEGYNIATTVNGKTILGRTTDNLQITAKTKGSQTKDDQGASNEAVVGHDVTISCGGLCQLGTSGATKLDRDAIMELALKKGSEAVIPITYGPSTGAKYQGNAIISDFSEDSNAEGDANWTLNLRLVSDFTKVTAG